MASKPNVSLLFRTAALHSEKIRIIGLLAALIFIALTMSLRAVLNESLRGLFSKTIPLLFGAILLETILLVLARKAHKKNQLLPAWIIILSVILETSLPTAALFIMTTESWLNPYSVLSAPAVSVYFLFLILSALRLNPALCILSGITAAAGYLAVMIFVYTQWPLLEKQDVVLGTSAHITYCVLLLLGGVLASVVAKKIRTEIAQGILQIEKSQRLEADLEVARSIQMGLLPRIKPELSNFDIAGKSWPADQTGGDYYDWLPLPDSRLAVTIADVTGHGIGPALLTANCHAYVHALFGAAGDLKSWVDQMNRFLSEDLEGGRFITFLAVLLHPQNTNASILSAGHGPTLRYSAADASVEELSTQGLPLGILADQEYNPPLNIPLGPGDFLILLTDGFTEWADSSNEQFGVDRAKESLIKNAALPSAQIIEQLRQDVLAFANGAPQKDDLTAVVIKRPA